MFSETIAGLLLYTYTLAACRGQAHGRRRKGSKQKVLYAAATAAHKGASMKYRRGALSFPHTERLETILEISTGAAPYRTGTSPDRPVWSGVCGCFIIISRRSHALVFVRTHLFFYLRTLYLKTVAVNSRLNVILFFVNGQVVRGEDQR